MDYPWQDEHTAELSYTNVKGNWVGLVGGSACSEPQDYSVDGETVSVVFYAFCYKPSSSYQIAARIRGTRAEPKTVLSGNNNQFVTLETIAPEDYSSPDRWELMPAVTRVIASNVHSGNGNFSGQHFNSVISYRVWSLHCHGLKQGHHLVGHKNYQKRISALSGLDRVFTCGSKSGLNDPTSGDLTTQHNFDSATLNSGESGYKLWVNWVEPAAGGNEYTWFGIAPDSTVGGRGLWPRY